MINHLMCLLCSFYLSTLIDLHSRLSPFFLQAMLEYLEKLQKEDMESLIKKRETQHNVMKDVAVANEVKYDPY